MATETMKELSYDGSKCVVEVARRDAKGNTIDETYLAKSEASSTYATQSALSAEASSRESGDSDTLASAKAYTDDEIAKVDHTKYVTIDTAQNITGVKNFPNGFNTDVIMPIASSDVYLSYDSLSKTAALGTSSGKVALYCALNERPTVRMGGTSTAAIAFTADIKISANDVEIG